MCRVFKKRLTTVRKMDEHEPLCWYDDQVSFMPDFDSPSQIPQPYTPYHNHQYPCKQELELQYYRPHERFLQLPHLESPKVPQLSAAASASCNSVTPYGFEQSSTLTQEEHMQQNNQAALIINALYGSNNIEQAVDQVTDWRVLDKFVASQLSQDQVDTKEGACSNVQVAEQINMLCNDLKGPDQVASESTSISTLSCQIDLWK